MRQILYPDLWFDQVTDIKLSYLEEMRVAGIICDLDNTIVGWGEKELDDNIENWFLDLKEAGYNICLVSNSLKQRVDYFADHLEVKAISKALKPSKVAFNRAAYKLSLSPQEIVVVGDQIFTDVVGGNRANMNTVLVNPLSSRELFFTKLIRKLEYGLKKKLTFKK